MLEIMMTMMSSFSEKLEAVEEHLTGLTSHVDTPSTTKV